MTKLIAVTAYVLKEDSEAEEKLVFEGIEGLLNRYDKIVRQSKKEFLISLIQPLERTVKEIPQEKFRLIVEELLPCKAENFYSDLIIRLFGSVGGKFSGEDVSPKFINDLMVSLADISPNDTILDPTVGLGGTLLSVLRRNSNQKCYGQEINTETAALAQIVIELANGKNAEIECGDVLTNPKYVQNEELIKFDKVLTIPPFGIRTDNKKLYHDKFNRFPFGEISKSQTDWAFISNAITSSKLNGGKAIIVVPDGALFRKNGEKIRERILHADLFEAIISLPGGLFQYTTIPTNILIFNRSKTEKRKNKIQFINISEKGIRKERAGNQLIDKVIEEVVNCYHEFKEVNDFSVILDRSKISAENMSAERYVTSSTFHFKEGTFEINLKEFLSDQSKVLSLGDVATIERGYNMVAKNENSDGYYRIVRISDIENDQIEYANVIRGNVEEGTKIENYELQVDDLILSIRGTTNKIAIVTEISEPTLIHTNLVRIRVNKDKYIPEFIKLFMQSPLGLAQFERISQGSTIRQLPMKNIKEYQLPEISVKEQQKIVYKFMGKERELQTEMDKIKCQQQENYQQLYTEMGISSLFEKIEKNK